MRKYISPKVEFNALKLKENVADTCWGFQTKEDDSKQPKFYYDVAGQGYVSFQLGYTGSCDSPNSTKILYYAYNNAEATNGDKYKSEIDAALKLGGGNSGQNYNGLTTDFPNVPKPSWS